MVRQIRLTCFLEQKLEEVNGRRLTCEPFCTLVSGILLYGTTLRMLPPIMLITN